MRSYYTFAPVRNIREEEEEMVLPKIVVLLNIVPNKVHKIRVSICQVAVEERNENKRTSPICNIRGI